MKKKTLIVVTGQLRNGADNLTNWLNTAFKGESFHFLYYIWNELGSVDTNKLYLRCLRTRKRFNQKQVEVSALNTYFRVARNLESEIDLIKKQLGERVTFVLETYNKDYLVKAGDLEANALIREENNPWWQGSVPVAYINHLAIKYIEQHGLDKKFNRFYRVQSESFFSKKEDYSEIFASLPENELLTSPDTISKKDQVSIKFFGGSYGTFRLFLDAYTPLVDAYKNYKKGIPERERPIGERFLKQLASTQGIKVNYDVKMKINREMVIPMQAAWKSLKKTKINWQNPTIIDVDRQAFEHLKKLSNK